MIGAEPVDEVRELARIAARVAAADRPVPWPGVRLGPGDRPSPHSPTTPPRSAIFCACVERQAALQVAERRPASGPRSCRPSRATRRPAPSRSRAPGRPRAGCSAPDRRGCPSRCRLRRAACRIAEPLCAAQRSGNRRPECGCSARAADGAGPCRGRAEVLDPAFQEVGAFGGEHDAGVAGYAGVDIGARPAPSAAAARHVGRMRSSALAKERRQLARRGLAGLLDAGVAGADPARVRRQRPGDQRDVLARMSSAKPDSAAMGRVIIP